MSFLLRMAFWLAVAFVLLPNPASRPVAPHLQPSGTQGSASAAPGAEPHQLCPRELGGCDFGAFATLFRNVYRLLGEPGGPRGSKAPAGAANAHDTLTPADLGAPWRGPPRKDTVARRSI